MAPVAATIILTVDRDGTHVEVRNAAGQVTHREGVGSPTSTVERQNRMTCTALLPADGADQLARVLLNAATRARQAGGE
jgi:hypothetical protein